MVEVRLSGGPEEIGRQRARELRSAILLALEHFSSGHEGQWGPEEFRAWGRRWQPEIDRDWPWLGAEIRAAAAELAVPEEVLFAFNFRGWNALAPHPSHMACYNIAWRDAQAGVVMGGVVEDGPPFYILEKVRPSQGLAFLSVTWAGMVWAVRGMNAAGLSVGQVSAFPGIPRHSRTPPGFGTEDYARGYFALRAALQEASSARQAADIVGRFQCMSTFMFADATGDALVLEMAVRHQGLRRSDRPDGLLIGGGHFLTPGVLHALVDDGLNPTCPEGHAARQRWVEEFVGQRADRLTVETMKELLTDHGGPAPLCNDSTQALTVAVPAQGELWVGGYRACQSGFRRYRLEP